MPFNITEYLLVLQKFFSINLNDEVTITVMIIRNSSSRENKLVRLNLMDNLLKIRKVLEEKCTIDNTLLFSKKSLNTNNDENYAEIALKDEENFYLDYIVDKNENILYLKQCSTNNVIITVIIIRNPSSRETALIPLNLTDNLSSIREELERDRTIDIDNTLLFSKKPFNNDENYVEIAFEKEANCRLDEIVDKNVNILYLKKRLANFNVMITVVIIRNSLSRKSKTALLNQTDNLLVIRQELKNNYDIDESLLFLRKYSEDNNESYEFAEIASNDEEKIPLNDIIYNNILYIKCKIKIDWNNLNNLRQLDYGCTMTFDEIKKASKRAFQMKGCEWAEIGAKGCNRGDIEFKSNEDWMMKTNLFFSADINVQNFVKLGMSIEKSKNENLNLETNTSYHYLNHGRVSLKFREYLEPAQDFIEAVKDAIKSKNPKNFKQITEEFGQFISTEVILGGRAHFSEHIMSTGYSAEKSNEIAMNLNMNVIESKAASASNYSKGKSTYCRFNCTKLIGGEPPSSLENFDEASWVKSLNEENWDCIEFRNPISIFQLLSDDLRGEIIKSIGKKIYDVGFDDYNYHLEEFGSPHIFELIDKISLNILNIIQNKDADCNIFATAVDTMESRDSKNDFFTCQVLWPTNGIPSLIIHCYQERFNKREYKLKIRWMVIGYYTDFNFMLSDFNTQLNTVKNENILNNQNNQNNQNMINTELLSFEYDSYVKKVPPCLGIPVLDKLDSTNETLIIGHHFFNEEKNKIGACTFSYCLKENHYVDLPNFTFHTLIITNYHVPNAYGLVPFIYLHKKKTSYIENNIDLNPKFISLLSTKKTDCGPIFLKQNRKQIKTKFISCEDKACFICALKISENNIKCALFDPSISQ